MICKYNFAVIEIVGGFPNWDSTIKVVFLVSCLSHVLMNKLKAVLIVKSYEY